MLLYEVLTLQYKDAYVDMCTVSACRQTHGNRTDRIFGYANGDRNSFALEAGENIQEVTVDWGTYVCSLTFTTSSSRIFGPYKSLSNLKTNQFKLWLR